MLDLATQRELALSALWKALTVEEKCSLLAMLGTSPFGTEEGWRKKRQKLHLAIVKRKGEILNLADSKRR